ncbi:MAG TPA: putative 2OG-Fe(II) oxygenase, partial [Sphingomicrobium sp.]|nr:putative 2OG-Fe(II) oxygenase [Sphingomicrobium sp.]
VERAAAAGAPTHLLALYRAIGAAELDQQVFPGALFRTAPHLGDQLDLWRIRHLLRLGAIDEALPIIDRELASPRAPEAWPYASIAWRLIGDDRHKWLEGDPGLVQIFDLENDLPKLDELGDTLRRLHVAKGEYVDQSVRGGTQTDGPLLCRIDPLIRKTRAAIVGSVTDYLARLAPIDALHPLLGPRRDRRIRFSGSWSVKLRGGGRHSNHVHTQGWISSALYISLPKRDPNEIKEAGWFTIGEPQDELGINLPPQRKIEPAAGHLVLFPSWMWHGTIPFAQGERLTIAFDVRPPI